MVLLEAGGLHVVLLGDVRPAPHQEHPRLPLVYVRACARAFLIGVDVSV